MTNDEWSIILNMLDADYAISEIVNPLGRSRETVYSVRNNPTKLCVFSHSGRCQLFWTLFLLHNL